MLTKPHDLFGEALKGDYAVGAFNTSNLEVTQAIVAAAESQGAPVVVQTSEGAIEYAGAKVLANMVKTIAEESMVPVVLHLDHGKSLEVIKQCLELGYGSVMIDASTKDFEENLAVTAEVVRYAHERGVWVEAELGAILGSEGLKKLGGGRTPDEMLTNPGQVKEFVQETGVDCLAVSVGTVHGAFTGREYIRFELLKAIEKEVPHLPLVIHGASGVPAEQIEKVVKGNVCKVNIDTELRLAFAAAVKPYFNRSHEKVDTREMLLPAREAVREVVESKIKMFGSSGKGRV